MQSRIVNLVPEFTGVLLCVGLGLASGFVTDPHSFWFQQLLKPSLYPPSWAFPVVWTLLYILMGVAVGQIYRSGSRILLRWFSIQFFFNLLWTPLFFYAQRIDLALIDMTALSISLLYCLYLAKQQRQSVYYLLLPYFLWLCFAFYLNASLWLLNSA